MCCWAVTVVVVATDGWSRGGVGDRDGISPFGMAQGVGLSVLACNYIV